MKPQVFFCRYLLLTFLIGSLSTLAPAGEDNPASPSIKVSEPSVLQKETFARLKKKFPGQMLDAEFKTLWKLAESPEYLNFLSKAHPGAKPFKTFEVFNQTLLYPKERYFKFLQEQFNVKNVDEINNEEQAIIHNLANTLWRLHARDLHGENIGEATMMTALMKMFMNKAFQNWAVQRGIIKNNKVGAPLVGFYLHFMIFVSDNQKADSKQVKTLLETHGRENGLLWLTLRDPILFGRILTNFTDTDLFLKWADGEFEKKQNKGENNEP